MSFLESFALRHGGTEGGLECRGAFAGGLGEVWRGVFLTDCGEIYSSYPCYL